MQSTRVGVVTSGPSPLAIVFVLAHGRGRIVCGGSWRTGEVAGTTRGVPGHGDLYQTSQAYDVGVEAIHVVDMATWALVGTHVPERRAVRASTPAARSAR